MGGNKQHTVHVHSIISHGWMDHSSLFLFSVVERSVCMYVCMYVCMSDV